MSGIMYTLIVPLQNDGPDMARLEELVQKHQFAPSGKLFWGVYYTIPTFHNPTGIVFSEGE